MSGRAFRVFVLAALALSLAVYGSVPVATSAATNSRKVAPFVLKQTANGRTATFLVVLKAQDDVAAAAAARSTKLAKGTFVFQSLRAFATRTQAPIKALLDRTGAAYRSHWIMNLLRVTGGRTVVDALAARPDVARIIGNPRVKSSLLPKSPSVASPNRSDTPEWNISRVKAPQVWSHGFTGQGIVLGDIDTGQQWDHPALKTHYRGWNGSSANHNYNWYDETNPANRVPVDGYHHGTGTAGIMVGDDGAGNQIGVAPGAKWMACRSMDNSGFGTPDTYIGCLEFMVAPWDLDGQNPDPAKAPVAVNNSWYCAVPTEGCTQGTLLPAVQNLRAAGIVPVFAAGNEGPSCDTVGDVGPPAQYDESYSVGATTMSNTLAIFSSRGPAHVPGKTLVKPDISAPGQTIRSSEPTNQYQTGDGTSFAAPHITGIIALIYSAKPNLIGNVAATEDLINHTAHHINTSDCSSSGTFPNNLYGWGFVNAAAATRP